MSKLLRKRDFFCELIKNLRLKLEKPQMTSIARICALLLYLVVSPAMAQSIQDETFPQPEALQPDVDFWVSIFSEYTTSQGVLHDSRNLGVVYGHLDYTTTDRRSRQRLVSARRQEIQAALRVLADGKREGLTVDQANILAAWPDDVSNATLSAAVGQIRHQQGLRDRFREGLERAGRWRGYIHDEFTALGVPLELSALPHVESSYNPNARSHVGASGIWQFTRSTGRRFMRVDHVIDERNDPFSATSGAGKLLAYNYSIAGNWPMAITAYNHGLSGVRRAQRQFGDTAYVEILRNYRGRTFGFASRNFYVAFLAAKHVDQNADQYFPNLNIESPVEYTAAELPNYVSAEDFAEAMGVSTRQLERSNLALQATILTGTKHLPKGMSLRLPASIVNGSMTERMANIPAASWATEQLPDLFHTVGRGDTLSQIAETYKTRVSTLVTLNGLSSSHRIRIGQKIRLPAAGPAPAVVAAATPEPQPATPDPVAEEPGPIEVAAIEEVTPSALSGGDMVASLRGTIQTSLLSDPSDYSVAGDNSIEVHPDETLGHYADWLDIRTQRLRDINGLAFGRSVDVGRRLQLDMSKVDAKAFESKRIEYHRVLQDAYFRQHVITGITDHEIQSGESIWILSLRDYRVPIWLFRQYNPELDLARVRPGMTVRFPVLRDVVVDE